MNVGDKRLHFANGSMVPWLFVVTKVNEDGTADGWATCTTDPVMTYVVPVLLTNVFTVPWDGSTYSQFRRDLRS